MPDNPRVIYWDSCVFLHYFGKTPEYIGILDTLLAESRKKAGIEIYTSILSIVEVAYIEAEQTKGAPDAKIEKALDEFWFGGEVVQLVEFHQLISMEARKLIRMLKGRRKSLKAADAIHVATALRLKANEFHTYDDGLLKKSKDLGITICKPYIRQPTLL